LKLYDMIHGTFLMVMDFAQIIYIDSMQQVLQNGTRISFRAPSKVKIVLVKALIHVHVHTSLLSQ